MRKRKTILMTLMMVPTRRRKRSRWRKEKTTLSTLMMKLTKKR